MIKETCARVAESECYSGFGKSYCGLNDFKKAIEFHEKSLKIDKEIGYKTGEYSSYIDLGDVYRKQNKLEDAYEYYADALDIVEEISDKYHEIIVLLNICLISIDKDKKQIGEKAKRLIEEMGIIDPVAGKKFEDYKNGRKFLEIADKLIEWKLTEEEIEGAFTYFKGVR
ncbi:MAG: hypothetical protein A7316_05155 [Candidatus Altiarchaeales archaeon WOR_SM1_86-2]|nr:MAG: hypothetical protein A7316_05155 [Candidatus Altiarchaeales archaeon WOR_SM1_86-2]ODS41108.1 MAG: hypothetical protein A7315_07015 [Candidatus Altiarchaeales archaeon WOR_SM1_79]